MVAVVLDEVTKVFSEDLVAVDRLSLDIASGEYFVLIGPTGCGKSTVLRLIAGLDRVTSGHIRFDGRDVNDVPAWERGVGMVFESYALHPHLTVAENISMPLRVANKSHQEVAGRVAEIAALLGITDLLHRTPGVLSGGQRQRTAMARAILRDPRVFLLDEPLSNLDAAVRAELRTEISRLTRELGVTTIHVTHDQTEAMTMADRVAVLRRGVLQQVGTPHEVYAEPETLFVAAFLGMPRMNLLQAAVYRRIDGGVDIDLGAQLLTVPADLPLAGVLARHHNDRVTVGLRPDSLQPAAVTRAGIAGAAADPSAELRGRVRLVEHLGHEVIVHVDTESVPAVPESVGLDHPDIDLNEALSGELPAASPLHQMGDALRHPIERLPLTRSPGQRTAGQGTAGQGTAGQGAAGQGNSAQGTSGQRGGRLRIPRQRRPEQAPTARTEYGFYPTYEAPKATPPMGDVLVRLPAAAAPRLGESVVFSVPLKLILLFDRTGRRIHIHQRSEPLN